MESPSQVSPRCSSLPDLLTLPQEQDAFIGFVEYARSVISPEDRDSGGGAGDPGPSWSWIVSRIIKTCVAYSSGVTPAILLSDLFQAWGEQHRYATSKKKLECMIPLERRHRRTKLPNTVSIDSIHEKNFLSPNSILEAIIVDTFILPGTSITMLCLGDIWSSSTIDMYLHRRYCHLVGPNNGILKKGREILLTGCHLRTAVGGSGQPRLLPTEYLVIVLNECRIRMKMRCFWVHNSAQILSHQSLLMQLKMVLHIRFMQELNQLDHQKHKVLLSNLFSIGSMLALDRPFVADAVDCEATANQEISLEYGSATQLYLVPFIQHEEQVLLASTQMRYRGSSLSTIPGQSQGSKLSQVSLPLDSQGSIDFSNYPFRSYVIDLHDKMAAISLYGSVLNIKREPNTAGTVFSMIIEDTTGAITAKLHFVSSWSLGRLGDGHVVYISGLNCSMTPKNLLEVSWFEKDHRASLVNISCLPALLNSSCLHRLSSLSDISNQRQKMHICCVSLDCVEHYHINSMLCHAICGHHVKGKSDGSVICSFCGCSCDGELVRNFHLSMTLADQTGKVIAWCTGQTAAELLQISPDEFFVLPEDEQAMYLCTLGTDRFTVSLVCCTRPSGGSDQDASPDWEIVRAQKSGCDSEYG